MTHPWFAGRTPRILAHRGFVPPDADGIVENSFAAIAAAHAAGAGYIESDCHVTADGHVVLLHDADLSRVVGDPRPVAQVTLAELERLMSGIGGLITLRQALEGFPDVRFNLDVKTEAAAVPVGRAVAPHAERVLLASFSDARRRAALDAAGHFGGGIRPATSAGTATIARVLTAVRAHTPWMVRRALAGVDALQIPERRGPVRVLTPRLIDAAHRCGVEVHVWTVNDPLHMARLVELGVDGLVTDRTDLALRAVAKGR
ncbi:glycerophosphodiester phosphodiesterase [Microbacterium sp. zg.Y625]|uniref:glycerophosphodiester phosphodiesterase family protein n=1 Tax=Microbacterium jiangjiandongii TaxID=3049071 RepID=UPI00214CB286|nr:MULTISPECIES: glycerophosphodiester phosphodiesterase family protein [unclassified Microbacterium]MCR2792599.1 glycerophosphodiester phosphodiesterase [Microbacterium sp. zg.Y625]MCR2814715.1 glycerophosphodiester phosphodiesterase [Microbacterium sp. zg.Y843]WIM26585.1 glycerophosphodiester phosphodiesterase family protein [Microbacterium sp. zg-Y625]